MPALCPYSPFCVLVRCPCPPPQPPSPARPAPSLQLQDYACCGLQWVDHGYYSELSVGDIKDEIFDMVKPEDELAITLQELIDCKVSAEA